METSVVIGASGQVGEHLIHALKQRRLPVAGTCYRHPQAGLHELDLRDEASVSALLSNIKPGVIYLPASLTNVDYCETHPEEGYAINVIGVRNVVQAANRIGAQIVYSSSDYIFDGSNGPYLEDDPANPISVYGRQKLAAEHYLSLFAQNYLIVRTTVVYGWESQEKNFVYRLIHTLRDGHPMRVPVDQIGSPTYAPDLAQAVVDLVEQDAGGVFHVAGSERVSRYDFAVTAAEVFGLDASLIQPVSTRELNQAALRPLNAGVVVDKAERVLQRPLLPFREGLKRMAESQEQSR